MVYKLFLSRMPDENQNPIWGNQTSQNNQAVTNQSWNDFVLDFGDIENKLETENLVTETTNLGFEQVKSEESVSSIGEEFDSWELFDNNKKEEIGDKAEDDTKNEVEMQAEKTDKWVLDNDFSISFDNTENVSQDNNKIELDENISLDSNENLEIWKEGKLGNENNFKEVENNIAENNSSDSVDLNLEFSEDLQDNQDKLEEDKIVAENDIAESKTVEETVDSEDNKLGGIFVEQNDSNLWDENNETTNENIQEDVKIQDNEEKIINENDKSEDDFLFDIWDDNNVSESDIAKNEVVNNEKEKNDIINNEVVVDKFEKDGSKSDIFSGWTDLQDKNDNNIAFDENLQENVSGESNEEKATTSDENQSDFTFDLFDNNTAENNVESVNVVENEVVENQAVDNNILENSINENLVNSVENNEKEIFSDKKENDWEKDLNNWIDVNLNAWEFTVSSENESSSDSNQEETVNTDLSFSLDNVQQPLNQPELWDLLWNSSVDFSEVQENSVNLAETDASWEVNQEPINLQENVGLMSENDGNKIESSQIEDNNSSANNVEDQVFTLDSQNLDDSISQNEVKRVEAFNENSWWLNQEAVVQANIDENVNAVNAVQETMVQTSQVEPQQITSTLSLDQILDTELNSNPQFADNSKAVPVNVPNKNGKKLVWIVAWIWLFLLAWMVVVLAFPSGNLGGKPWDSVDTGENIEVNIDYTMGDNNDNHNSAEIDTGDDRQWNVEQGWWEVVFHNNKTTVTVQQPEFPDAGYEVDSENILIGEKPDDASSLNPIIPYICDWDDCVRADDEWENTVQLKDAMSHIRDLRSQAEAYYEVWDEQQDKKLIKYSLQAILLCDNYQAQIDSGVWLDEDSFSSFKTKWEALINKIEKYLGNPDWENYQ